jgi:hypothetical protein
MEEFVYKIKNKVTGVFYGGPYRVYLNKPDLSGFAPSWTIITYKLIEIHEGCTAPKFEDKEERP